jgi:hypothetical protein
MSEFFSKSLGAGQLPNSKTTIYTVPALKSTLIRSVILVNSSGSAVTVNLYAKVSGGSSRRLIPVGFSIPAYTSFEFDSIVTMSAADQLEGDASTASVVDYSISGVEGQ